MRSTNRDISRYICDSSSRFAHRPLVPLRLVVAKKRPKGVKDGAHARLGAGPVWRPGLGLRQRCGHSWWGVLEGGCHNREGEVGL